MYTKYFNEVKTIDDTVTAAIALHEEAKTVSNEREHATWWDKKVELLRIINSALETGYWAGSPNYDKLWSAKNTLFRAEDIAGNYSK